MASRRFRAPYRFVPGESLELLAEPRATWDRLLADLAAAQRRVVIENYIFEDGQAGEALSAALEQAARAGVDVRVQVDAVGSAGLSAATARRLREAGVKLRFFNPIRLRRIFRARPLRRFFRRTHRRIVVVDSEIGWLGGLAFADLWWPGESGCPTRETMLRLRGPAVAQLEEEFFRLWDWPPRFRWPKRVPEAAHGEVRIVPHAARHVPWFRRALYRRMARSRERVWIATPYFIPPVWLRHRLRAAVRRGADVRLLLPGLEHDHRAVWFAGRRYYGKLLRGGVRIWEYQDDFMHAKNALFDQEWTLVGSANLDRWSLYVNYELAAEARDRALATELERQFEADFACSREVRLEEWTRRPLWNRFLEHFFGVFDSAF